MKKYSILAILLIVIIVSTLIIGSVKSLAISDTTAEGKIGEAVTTEDDAEEDINAPDCYYEESRRIEKENEKQTKSNISLFSASNEEDYSYEVLDDGTISITAYNGGYTYGLEIPSTIDGKEVSKIESYAFYYADVAGPVTIPDTVKTIDSMAFYYCDRIGPVKIGSGVTYIDPSAFILTYNNKAYEVDENNKNYTSIDGVIFSKDKKEICFYPQCKSSDNYIIPSTVETVGKYCFAGCASIKNITMPNSVKTLEYAAFAECIRITEITLSSNLETIGEYAFNYLNIETITIPAKVKEIGATAFVKAEKLKSINVDTNNKYYFSVDGILFNKDKSTLLICPAGKTETTYTIPNTVKTVEENAFIDVPIESIIIPSSVEELKDWCFARTNINTITIPNTVKKMGAGICSGCTQLESAIVNSSVNLPYEMFYECKKLSSVTLNNNIEEFNSRAFMNCTSLTEIMLPTNLKRIVYSFIGCTNLKNVVIPAGVTYINSGAFPETTNIDISKTKLIKLETGDYAVASDIYVKGGQDYDYAYKVLDIVNKEREKVGASPLKMDESLLNSAMERAAEVSVYFDHTRPNSLSCYSINSKMSGENIAAGTSNPETVMSIWMNSSGHKANILRTSFNSIGIGLIQVGGVTYWVQCFGTGEAEEPKNKPSGGSIKTYKIQTVESYILPRFSNNSDVTLKVGEKTSKELQNDNTWVYSNIEGNSAKWTSSNTKVATVDSYGNVTAVGVGKTTITAQICSKSISYNVNVTLPFIDVKKGDWFYTAVEYCYNNRIIMGATDTEFRPTKNITRGMIVTILWRMEGEPKVTGIADFPDVTGQYYYNAVRWAAKNKIVSGYNNGKFGPNDNITREQLATILCNYAKYKGKNVNKTADTSKYVDWYKVTGYARPSMNWAVSTGVVTGKYNGTKVDPQGTASRAEAAGMIYNYCMKIK